MRRILSFIVVSLIFTGNVWAQTDQQIDEEFYKRVPKNAYLSGKLQTTVTTDVDLKESWLKAGRVVVGKLYDEFSIMLEKAVLDSDGRVLIEDGTLAYGVVVYSTSYLDNDNRISKLELALTRVQKRGGGLGRLQTKNLVFIEKRPSKKSVWFSALSRASVYSLIAMPSGGGWWIFGGVYGFGSGKGEYGYARKVYQPKDITLFEGRKLYFKVEKDRKCTPLVCLDSKNRR